MSDKSFASVESSVRAIIRKIERGNQKADNDNKLVYFQDIPSDNDRQPLPGGAMIMSRKTLDVTAWEQLPIVLFFRIDGGTAGSQPSEVTHEKSSRPVVTPGAAGATIAREA
jgi:hypothetical protein